MSVMLLFIFSFNSMAFSKNIISIPSINFFRTSRIEPVPVPTPPPTEKHTEILRVTQALSDSLNAEIKIKTLKEWKHYQVMDDCYKYLHGGNYILRAVTKSPCIYFYDYFAENVYQEIMYSYKRCVEYIRELQTINILYNGFCVTAHNSIIFSQPVSENMEATSFPLLCDFSNSVDLSLSPYPKIPKKISWLYSSIAMKILYIFDASGWKVDESVMTSDDWKSINKKISNYYEIISKDEYNGLSRKECYYKLWNSSWNKMDVYGLTQIYLRLLSCVKYENKHHTKFVGILNAVISADGCIPDSLLQMLDYY